MAALSFVSPTIQTATRLVACASFSTSPRPASSWSAVLLVALAGPGLARAGSFREEIAESILKARRVERERVRSHFAENNGLRFSRPPSWWADTGSGFSIDTGPSGRHQTGCLTCTLRMDAPLADTDSNPYAGGK